jgi:hypothetical protein
MDHESLKIFESGILWIAGAVLAYPFRRTIFRVLLVVGLAQVICAGILTGFPMILDEWGSHAGLLFAFTSLGVWLTIAVYLAAQERKERKSVKL